MKLCWKRKKIKRLAYTCILATDGKLQPMMLMLNDDGRVNNQSEVCERNCPTHTALNCGIDS